MAIPTFPSLTGLAFPVKKTPLFKSIAHESVAGQTTVQAPQAYARYAFDLPFEMLRSDNVNAELQQLMGLYQLCQGRAQPFHFKDPDDYTVTAQPIGVGDGATSQFAFLRSLGTVADPLQDVDIAGVTVYLNGTPTGAWTRLFTAQYSTFFGVQFNAAPGAGVVITADFTYHWLCRFDEDTLEFEKFAYLNGVNGTYSAKSVKFTSLIQ